MNYKSGICTFCGTGCGHLLDVRDNAVRGVFPVKNHPVSRGRLCVRGWNVHELLNTPERIVKPLIRKNGVLTEASYDEAIGLLVRNLSKQGEDRSGEIGFLASPRSSNEENYLLMKLARSVFNSGNISLDSDPGHRTTLEVLRESTGMPGMLGSLEEISWAEFILVAGIDITKQNPIIGSEIHRAARAGANVVTLDTRKTQIARLSRTFVPVRPGSFNVAMASMAKAIIDGKLQDAEYIRNYTEGFEVFSGMLSSLKNGDVAEKTGVDPAVFRNIAQDLAKARTAMVFFSSGISGFDRETVGFIFDLFLAAGKIGKEGCGVNPITGINNLQGSCDMGMAPDLLTGFQQVSDAAVAEKFSREWKVKQGTAAGKPIYDLLGSGRLKSLVVMEHDESIIRNINEIRKLDFVAYIGAYRNNFMDHAHLVLPVASYIETDGTFTSTERRVQLSRKKVEPPAGVLPGWKLMAEIAAKAGAKWGYAGASDVMAEIARLTPSYAGITYEKLAASFGIQWPCTAERPGGTPRYDIATAGTKARFTAVHAVYRVPRASAEYPFLLNIGEAQNYWHQNNLMKKTSIPLREYNATLMLYPQGYVALSPQDAKELGVRDRASVMVVSPYGSMETMVQVNDKVYPRTAYAAYFVNEMVTRFFMEHREVLKRGEDAAIPVRIVKV